MSKGAFVRHLDDLGRVVVPKALRNTLGWPEGSEVEILVDGEEVRLRRYLPGCELCGETQQLKVVWVGGRHVRLCWPCMEAIADAAVE